ncbi:glycosyltransferase family 2 protein [Rhodanobacter sp. Col0626]|uniref:glycosyltransferase family 2 protein n=1 Tax=Rhodanobacter sp. Col0626 TaxID=3415679 RepID=UPI003CF2B883
MNAISSTTNIGHVRVHSVLYANEPRRIAQTVAHLNRAADLAIAAGAVASVTLVYGDSSSQPVLNDEQLSEIKSSCYALRDVQYVDFQANLGSAKGHNTLIAYADASETTGEFVDAVLIMNPDVMLAPDALIELARPLASKNVGLVEARQLPIEHPKEYNRLTGDTEWATTACALIPIKVLRELNGFDSDTFFLYCDDVDFSWRARLAGYRVVYQPSAAAFHDKRLAPGGKWAPTTSEQYFSAEAAILIAYKYSRPDIAKHLHSFYTKSDSEHLRRAAAEFDRRKEAHSLPDPIDPKHSVAVFKGDFYTKHRFPL